MGDKKKKAKEDVLTVGDMISRLKKFNPNHPIVITDGHEAVCYRGVFDIKEFEGTVDIGVGGTKWTEN